MRYPSLGEMIPPGDPFSQGNGPDLTATVQDIVAEAIRPFKAQLDAIQARSQAWETRVTKAEVALEKVEEGFLSLIHI